MGTASPKKTGPTFTFEPVEVAVGQLCRSELGGKWMRVVAADGRFVYVKRADESKKNLARVAGSYPVARSEFASWTIKEEEEEEEEEK